MSSKQQKQQCDPKTTDCIEKEKMVRESIKKPITQVVGSAGMQYPPMTSPSWRGGRKKRSRKCRTKKKKTRRKRTLLAGPPSEAPARGKEKKNEPFWPGLPTRRRHAEKRQANETTQKTQHATRPGMQRTRQLSRTHGLR